MAKKNETKLGSRKTVTVDLEKLRKAIDELAPGNRHMDILERALRESEHLTGGPEMGLVREMSGGVYTILDRGRTLRIMEDISRMVSFWNFMKCVPNENVCRQDIERLAEDAIDKLFEAKNLIESGCIEKRKDV